jgi:hypothetical protein
MHVINNLTFGAGCRCCYDPNQDGGEYQKLIDLRAKLYQTTSDNQDMNGEEQNGNDTNNEPYREGEENSDSDDEFDFLLDEPPPTSLHSFQQDRIEEIQLNALIYESAFQHGFGAHRQFHPARVLHAAGLGMGGIRGNRAAAIPPAAVVHLVDAESDLSASLDLCLEKLGETYKGTKYVRAPGRLALSLNEALAKEVLPKISKESGIPALVAVRDGVVVAVCPNLSALGDKRSGIIEPRAVEHWLDNARVLLRDVPLEFEDFCRIRPEEDALLENMMREKAQLDEVKDMIFDCGVNGCNKTFHHEHVGIKNEQQNGLVVSQDIALGSESN